MKKITLFFTLAAATLISLSSCSGSGSDKDSLFGSLPSEYSEFKEASAKLDEQAKNIRTEADKAELIEKSKKLQEKWTPKLEKAAQALDGKEINLTEDLFKVTAPVTLTYEKLVGKSLIPSFKVSGSAETTESTTFEKTYSTSRVVYIAGYDAEGNEVFKNQVGKVAGKLTGSTLEIPAGTAVEFGTLNFDSKNIEGYEEAKTLKLIL